METQTNNNNNSTNEVDELRQQLALFKQRLDQQEIINERLLRRSMNARLNVFTKTSVICDIVVLFFMPIVFVAFKKIGVHWFFGASVAVILFIELIYNIISHRHLQQLFNKDKDLLTVRRGLLKFKRMERVWMLIAVPLIILWTLAFYWQLGLFSNHLTGASAAGIIASAIGMIIGLAACFGFFAWEMRRVNNSIREIDDMSAE